MKICLCILVFATSFVFQSSADIFFTETMSNSQHTNTWANGDWWELYNSGPSAVSLDGWSWDDDSAIAGTVNFNVGLSLASGESLIVIEEADTHIDTFKSIWGLASSYQVLGQGSFTYSVWPGLGAAGDTLWIFDASSNAVDSKATGSQSSPYGGMSFAGNVDNEAFTRSSAGVYGAWQTSESPTFDIGSPGFVYAVPEPTTLSLIGLAGLVAVLRRYRRPPRDAERFPR